jgi:hypothetical protein
LHLGEPSTEIPPPVTWREYFVMIGEKVPEKLSEFRHIDREYWISPKQLNQPMHDAQWEDYWILEKISNAKAFHYLRNRDLGPAFRDGDDVVGGIDLLDCPGMGSYRVALAEDELSLSLLQNRLNELQTSVAIKLHEPVF